MATQLNAKGQRQQNHGIFLLFQAGIFLAILVCVVMPIYHQFYIYPSFHKQLIKITENEAIRSGKHMMHLFVDNPPQKAIDLSEAIKAELNIFITDFSLMKIKVFNSSGKIVFSTSKEEIGQINQKEYFHEIVAKGNPYTLVVQKNSNTLEDKLSLIDVVETYVPMMNKGEFKGAFEIYYDITARKEALEKLNLKIRSLLLGLSLFLLITIAVVFFKGKRMLIERHRMEEELEYLANTDTLTRISNRRHFLTHLNFEISRFIRYSHPASLLLFDIDHFKSVNDNYGHQVGDEVLRMVAQTCNNMLRENDLIGRYGGEEFIIFLPETSKDKALLVAEKIRAAIELMKIPYKGSSFSITVSIGVAPMPAAKPISEDILISQADHALYQAKNSGRNRVICYQKDQL